MAEKTFKLDFNGQAVEQADFNLLGQTAGLADERVLAELVKLTPFDGSSATKGILPGHYELVVANGASGSVLVNPFRAMVGSRTAVATDALANLRDTRSAISVAEGSTSLGTTVSFAANSTGNPRWDLIYAAVTVDGNGPTSSVLVKDPTSGVMTSQTVSKYARTTMVLGVVQGTAAASPNWPTAPSDSGTVYYIPIAYIRVPNGFGATSTVGIMDIGVVANTLRLHRLGPAGVEPGQWNNALLTAAQIQSWGSTGTRPSQFLPSSMVGGSSLVFYLDSTITNNTIIDARDWRGRICRWTVHFSTDALANQVPAWSGSDGTHGSFPTGNSGTEFDFSGVGCVTYPTVFTSHPLFGTTVIGNSASVSLYQNTSGQILVSHSGASPAWRALIWLEFSAPIDAWYR